MRPDLLEQVRAFLAEHPNATLQSVQNAVGARRADVAYALHAVRETQHPDLRTGTEGNRSHPGSRPSDSDLHSQGEPTMPEEDQELAISAAFEQVGQLLQEPVDVLLAILSDVQRSPELKSEGARVFRLLGKLLAFKAGFESELRETAQFLEAFRLLARETGQVPDGAVVEALLAEPYVASETPAAEVPPVEISSRAPVEVEPAIVEPAPHEEPFVLPEPSPEELELRTRRVREMLARQ